MMVRQGELGIKTPFNSFICATCGKTMASHWLYKPDKLADVFALAEGGRKPDGKYYCNRDQLGFAGSYFQRTLRRTMVEGYAQVS